MLKSLTVQDFTVFSEAAFTFGDLNVIHGENSTGKTHVLKLAYSALSALTRAPNEPGGDRPTKADLERKLGNKLAGVFRPDKGKIGRLARRVQGTTRANVGLEFGEHGALEYSFSTRSELSTAVSRLPSQWLTQAPVYVPTRELLSVYPGFVSLYETQAIPFEETWRDTSLLLGAPVARGVKKQDIAALLKPLEASIGCTAILDGDRFYVQMSKPSARVEADLVAEGYRKLAMVARLIANGSLEDKGYLFWDEPEANLNPRLIRELAPLLLGLAAGGVQVFVATHSLFLLRELEIIQSSQKPKVCTRYFGLKADESGVIVQQGEHIADSGDIASLDEDLGQSDRYLVEVP